MTQVLTPSGYRDASLLRLGDEVCAFDAVTGDPIINVLETDPQWIDHSEWARWWQTADEVPPFRFYRINGTWTLNSEQSIWRNGINVCHAKHLVVGDVIYDDEDNDVVITSVDEVTAQGWWRFDVSGDHSYIIDGLTVHNASRFWVGGTGNLDGSSTTNIAATSGGASGASYPGSADTMAWDANSGGGTTTVTAAHTLVSITMGGYASGTWDNSVGNYNFTLSNNGTAFSGTGSATRTIRLGSATYTLTGNNGVVTFASVGNLTFVGSSATITFAGNSARTLNLNGLTIGTINIGAGSGPMNLGSGCTIGTLNITAPAYIVCPTGQTWTITNPPSWIGSSSAQIGFASATGNVQVTFAPASGATMQWCAFRDILFSTGSPVADDSFNLGNNNGITINPPSVGGGTTVVGVIGS